MVAIAPWVSPKGKYHLIKPRPTMKLIYKFLTRGFQILKRFWLIKSHIYHDLFSFLPVLYSAHYPAPAFWNFPEALVMIIHAAHSPSLPSHTVGRGGFPPPLTQDRARWLALANGILADAKGADTLGWLVGFGLTSVAQVIYRDSMPWVFSAHSIWAPDHA